MSTFRARPATYHDLENLDRRLLVVEALLQQLTNSLSPSDITASLPSTPRTDHAIYLPQISLMHEQFDHQLDAASLSSCKPPPASPVSSKLPHFPPCSNSMPPSIRGSPSNVVFATISWLNHSDSADEPMASCSPRFIMRNDVRHESKLPPTPPPPPPQQQLQPLSGSYRNTPRAYKNPLLGRLWSTVPDHILYHAQHFSHDQAVSHAPERSNVSVSLHKSHQHFRNFFDNSFVAWKGKIPTLQSIVMMALRWVGSVPTATITAFLAAVPSRKGSIHPSLFCVLGCFPSLAQAIDPTRVGHNQTPASVFSVALFKKQPFVLALIVIFALIASIIVFHFVVLCFLNRQPRLVATVQSAPLTPTSPAIPPIAYLPSNERHNSTNHPTPILNMGTSLTVFPPSARRDDNPVQQQQQQPSRSWTRPDVVVGVVSAVLTFVSLVIAGLSFGYSQRAQPTLKPLAHL